MSEDGRIVFLSHGLAMAIGTIMGVSHASSWIAFGLFFAIINFILPQIITNLLKIDVDAIGGSAEVMRAFGIPSMSAFLYAWILTHNVTI
jgi:hypothetical protein